MSYTQENRRPRSDLRVEVLNEVRDLNLDHSYAKEVSCSHIFTWVTMTNCSHFIAKKESNDASKNGKAVSLQICFNKGLFINGFLIIFGSSLQIL